MDNEERKALFRELDEGIGKMDYPELLADAENILRYNETADSEAYLGLCLKRASELGMRKNLEKVIRLRRERQRMERADADRVPSCATRILTSSAARPWCGSTPRRGR